jgi:branched-chain amino acid transport system substrate-binding protein
VSRRVAAGFLAAALALLGGCSNAATSVSNSGNTDGVFPDHIVVGGLASVTGPLNLGFGTVFDGVNAYFDMVNAQGGIDGRRLELAHQLDDEGSPSLDADQVRTLVDQYHVFGVVGVATPSFTGATYLASQDVPSFGMNVNPNSQWGAGPSMFGNTGSWNDFTSPQVQAAFLAEQHHVKAAVVVSYAVAQAQQACATVVSAFHKYGIPVAFSDLSIPAPATDLHADVSRIKASGGDFVASCMDLSGNVLLSNTMAQEGVTGVTQDWFQGYNPEAVAQFSTAMEGVYLLIQHVPFEVTQLEPGKYPGMDLFESMLHKYFPGSQPSEPAIAGWQGADLFVTGLRALGHDVTRSRLVHYLNTLKAWTADGTEQPVDWTVAHGPHTGSTSCSAFVVARAGHFLPAYGVPPSVFSCFPVPPPASAPVELVTTLPPGVPPNPPAEPSG